MREPELACGAVSPRGAKSKGEHIINVLAFVTLGLLAGIGVGLLVAKKPGAQLRTELRAAVNDALSPPRLRSHRRAWLL